MFEYMDLQRTERKEVKGKEMKIKTESLQQNAMQIAFMDCEYK